MELREAVDLINNFRRNDGDPDLILIERCVDCSSDFPSLPADVAYKKKKGIEPRCRICAKNKRKIQIREIQQARRKRLKEE